MMARTKVGSGMSEVRVQPGSAHAVSGTGLRELLLRMVDPAGEDVHPVRAARALSPSPRAPCADRGAPHAGRQPDQAQPDLAG